MAELDLASLVVSVRADVRDAATGIDQLNSKLDTIGKTTDKVGQDTAKVQQEMSSGWTALNQQLQAMGELYNSIGKPLSNFFKSAVNGASDLQETVSKTNVVFGELADEVLEWSESATTTMGLSRNSALSMASAFGDLATSMGLARSQSQSMAMNLTQLAADLASFKNIDAQQAFTALQGIFTGNAQALKSLGVVMNEATLEAYALSQGITTSYQSMSESEKVALRYNYVLAQTANAQGDFARTSGGYANATRTLEESVSDLTASFGEMLLPMMETIIGAITDIVQFINDMPDGIKAIIVAIGVAGTALLVLIPIITKATAAFTAMSAAMSANPIGLIVAGVAAAVSAIAVLASSFASATKKSEEEAEKINKQVAAIKSELATIDGKYDADFEVFVNDNTATVEQKVSEIATTFGASVGEINKTIDSMVQKYGEMGLSIPVAVNAEGWKAGGSPNDLDDEERNVNVDLTGISLDTDEIDGKGTVSVDTYAPADSFDTDAIQGADVSVDATFGTIIDGRSTEERLKAYGVPVVASNEILVDYDAEKSFTGLNQYIKDTLLRAYYLLINENDTSTALAYANEVKMVLENLMVKVNTDSETEFYNSFKETIIDPIVATLTALDAKITSCDTSKIDEAIAIAYTNAQLKILTLNAKLASLDTTDANSQYEAFKAGIQSADNACHALLMLNKDTTPQTQLGEKLLERLEAIKEKYDPEVDVAVGEGDAEELAKIANSLVLIAMTTPALWNQKSGRTLEQLRKAIYYDATGKETSGDLVQDIINLRAEINAGFGDSSSWTTFSNNVATAIGEVNAWEQAVDLVNTALNNTLQTTISIRKAELEQRKADAYMAKYQAMKSGDTEREKVADREIAMVEQQLTTYTTMAEAIKQIAEKEGGGFEKFAEMMDAAIENGISLEMPELTGEQIGQTVSKALLGGSSELGGSALQLYDTAKLLNDIIRNAPTVSRDTEIDVRAIEEENANTEKRLLNLVDEYTKDLSKSEASLFSTMLKLDQAKEENNSQMVAAYNRVISGWDKDERAKVEKEVAAYYKTKGQLEASLETDDYAPYYKDIIKDLGQIGKYYEEQLGMTRDELATQIEMAEQLYKDATDPELKNYYKDIIDSLQPMKDAMDMSSLIDLVLKGTITDEDIENMTGELKTIASWVKDQFGEDGIMASEDWQTLTSLISDYMMSNLQTGAANNPMENGDTISTQNNFNGETTMGDKNVYYNTTYNYNGQQEGANTMEQEQSEKDNQDKNNASSIK